MITILSAETGEALEQLIILSQEYVSWMLTTVAQEYPELDVGIFASEHNYDDIQKKFPGEHVPPDGCLLIAMNDGEVAGCIALGRLTEKICEVRTLFVRSDCRGLGIGKQLVSAILDNARQFGYDYARLDTLGFMKSAQGLYKSFGFYAIEPYGNISERLIPYIHFLECKL